MLHPWLPVTSKAGSDRCFGPPRNDVVVAVGPSKSSLAVDVAAPRHDSIATTVIAATDRTTHKELAPSSFDDVGLTIMTTFFLFFSLAHTTFSSIVRLYIMGVAPLAIVRVYIMGVAPPSSDFASRTIDAASIGVGVKICLNGFLIL
ncbi:hypothetical protein ACLOJK_000217 [Asimina triloba]